MRENRVVRQICGFLEKLEAERVLILVEGKKDKRALERLGCSTVQVLGRSLFKTVESLQEESRVALLVDLDVEGRKLYARLSAQLRQRGVKVDDQLRHFLYRFTPLRHIEGLDTYVESLQLNRRRAQPGKRRN